MCVCLMLTCAQELAESRAGKHRAKEFRKRKVQEKFGNGAQQSAKRPETDTTDVSEMT